ncbi:MAG: SCP2 sterol-binding domain-containing protein [Betaproteobacteria bacterium]|nr:SCP2 sterol-binding domain-containing protein [Betaproteobacteria bacterium]
MIGGVVLAAAAGAVVAAPELMSEEWAKAACTAWNADATLTAGLQESGWVANDKKRGYKALQVARKDCTDSPKVEVRIASKDGKALCVSGGRSVDKLDLDVDYAMTADTKRWIEMGKGEYGPMRAMMFGRLSFDGPMGEAMGNMGPFESFLLLVGKVPGDTAACPK